VALHGYEGAVVQKGTGGTASVTATKFKPTGPVDVTFLAAADPQPVVVTVKHGEESFFLVDFVPEFPPQQAGGTRHIVVALDTSAGIGGPELERAKKLVLALLQSMPDTVRFNIVHGDYRTYKCLSHAAPKSEVAKAETCLAPLDAAGGSNIAALLNTAAKEATTFKGPAAVVLVSDGTATLGELDGDIIRGGFLEAVGEADITLSTVALGHGPNEDYLSSLAGAAGGHSVRMRPSDTPAATVETLSALLTQPLMSDVKVEVASGNVDGLSPFAVPNRSLGLARGEALAVMGKLVSPSATVKIAGTFRGKPIEKSFALSA
jgi:hypothetical protein